ncbi:MAG: PEP-CTERM sorting domain-containing protein [Verrucomicrobiaceae bacterium]|nr:MAG: PEP-CTERM sorting domain-containing protein [Verrucomicrobiaceae bacterium]
MKLKITGILLALVGSSLGATVTLSSVGINYDGSDDYGIVINGNPVLQGNGTASVGYFTISDSQVQNLASMSNQQSYDTLFSSFVSITSDNFTGINTSYGANPGFFSTDIAGYNAAGLNNTLYAYFRSGGFYGLFKSNLTIVPDLGGTSPEFTYALNLKPGSGTALIGRYGTSYQVPYNGIGAAPTMVQSFDIGIPEPSTTALGIIGTLGFFRRRRNR